MKNLREIEINEIVKQHTGYDVDFQYHKPKINTTTFIINNVDCSYISQEKIQELIHNKLDICPNYILAKIIINVYESNLKN